MTIHKSFSKWNTRLKRQDGVRQCRERRCGIRSQRGMEFKNSDRLNCILNTNNTRKYSFGSTSIKSIFHDRYRHVQERSLPLRKYSIPRFHFGLAPYFRYISLRSRKCYYKSRTVLRQSISHRRESKRCREKERKSEKKGCEFHRSVAKMESRKKTRVLQVRYHGA